MRGAVMHAPGDVRVEEREDPRSRSRTGRAWGHPGSARRCASTSRLEGIHVEFRFQTTSGGKAAH